VLELDDEAGDELRMNFLPKSGLKVLLLVLTVALLGGATAPRKAVVRHALHADAMRFAFRNFDGDIDITCGHSLASPDSPYDWKVQCFNPGAATPFAEYTAHVALTPYDHADGPTKFSLELLYWVMGTHLPSEVGTTAWYHFAAKSDLRGISVAQTVENGTAGLYLEIGSEAVRLSKWAR
jgi:hypothetical protein